MEIRAILYTLLGFPCGSAGKESACNARDLGSILGWEDPLEKGKATHSCSGLENSTDYTVHGVAESPTRLSDFHFQVSITLERSLPFSMGLKLTFLPK